MHPNGGDRTIFVRSLHLFRSAFDSLLLTLNSAGTLWIFGIAILVNADVLLRGALGQTIRGVPEMVSQSIVAIVFLQMTHTLKVGRFTRSDALLTRLALKHPRTAAALRSVHDLAGCGLTAILTVASFPLFLKAWEEDEFVGAVGHFTMQIWPIKLIIVVGAAALFVQYLRHLYGELRYVITGTEIRGARS